MESLENAAKENYRFKVIFSNRLNGLLIYKNQKLLYLSEGKDLKKAIDGPKEFASINMPELNHLEINDYISMVLEDGKTLNKKLIPTELLFFYDSKNKEYIMSLNFQEKSDGFLNVLHKNPGAKKIIHDGKGTINFLEAYENFSEALISWEILF